MTTNYSERVKGALSSMVKSGGLQHAARTGLATAVSLFVGRLCRMPEAYWAPITTIIVMQSTLGASWNVSKQRLIGTVLGVTTGALLASYAERGIIAFGAAIFALGLVCALLRLEQSAYRFAGITLAIVMLIVRPQAPWTTAMHRFLEVSIGIGVGLVFTAIWRPRELPRAQKPRPPSP